MCVHVCVFARTNPVRDPPPSVSLLPVMVGDGCEYEVCVPFLCLNARTVYLAMLGHTPYSSVAHTRPPGSQSAVLFPVIVGGVLFMSRLI